MVQVPEKLREQAKSNELILFVGAGVSRNSVINLGGVRGVVRPDSWGELLNRIAFHLGLVDKNTNPLNAEYAELSKSLGPLELAEYLKFVAKDRSLDGDIRGWINEGVELPEVGKKFEPNEWHDALLNLGEYGPRVTVTTNYNTLIETKFGTEGFATYNYKADNINNILTSPARPILKLHGCVKDLQAPLIISSSDYQWLEHEGKLMLDALRSLLMTRTALFVGYSLSDPDVNHILSSIFTRHHSSVEPAHFILHEKSPSIIYRKEMLNKWYGVKVLSYDASGGRGHDEGLEMLWSIGGR